MSDKKEVVEKDSVLDATLRPSSWNDYIGQKPVKENISILIRAALERGDRPEHILLYGPPGLGKTTLAHLISKETGGSLIITTGPSITKAGDLASLLTNLKDGDIFFIDEIHRLNRAIEEILYPAMESGALDILIGQGVSARSVRVDLPHFTLVAATTRISLISAPLRSRFSGGVFRLQYYTEDEIAKILERSASVLNTNIGKDSLFEISKRSRQTPRTANYLLKRCRDYAQVNKIDISKDSVDKALSLLKIDSIGLTEVDIDILKLVHEKFNDGPVGADTIAAALSEERATVEEVYEPYLLQLGFIDRTPRGRVITKRAIEHIEKNK